MQAHTTGPDSVTWRYAGDVRILAAAGYALVLQVAHPTVAAGVREHSDYARDPWRRLLRTLDYANVMVYGGSGAAVSTGRRLRRMHERIRGITPDGHRYTALEPEAWAWVHATLVEAMVTGHQRFGRPLDGAEVHQLYSEWHAIGALIGVGEGDLPVDWRGFRRYFDEMVQQRLQDNDVIHGVLASLARPAPPPVPLVAGWAWRIGRMPLARVLSLATIGLLPPTLRRRCGLRWTRAQQLELDAVGAAVRSLTPVLPGYLRNVGPGYLRWRREAITA